MSNSVTIQEPSNTVTIREPDGVVTINAAVIVEGSGGVTPTSGGGFVYVTDAEVDAPDQITDRTYQDTGNTVLQSFTSSAASIRLRIRASYPIVNVNGADATLPLVGGVFEGLILLTLTGGAETITAQVRDAEGNLGAIDTTVGTLSAPAQFLALNFSGGYPGAQTELKAGDTFDVAWASDNPIDAIQVANQDAGNGQLITFPAATSGTVQVTIPNRGNSVQALPLSATPRDATSGAFGAARSTNEDSAGVDGVNLVNLNNVAPTISFGAITYPATQGALKNAESATVVFNSSNLDTVVFSSPTSELSITDPTTIAASKTVTRIAGTLNESTQNLRAVANRAANDSSSTTQTVVIIQNVAPTISIILPAARLRSGGNDGTSPQDYSVTISSNQDLSVAPSLAADSGGNRGTFIGGGFVGSGKSFSRSIRVDETAPDEKGTFTFEGLSATNLAGLTQNVIGSGASYTLGGFVARSLTFPAFASQVTFGAQVVTFSKLQAGIFTATNQPALRQPIGTSPSVTNGYTIDGVLVVWLDTPAVNSNSGGTAQITDVEEVV